MWCSRKDNTGQLILHMGIATSFIRTQGWICTIVWLETVVLGFQQLFTCRAGATAMLTDGGNRIFNILEVLWCAALYKNGAAFLGDWSLWEINNTGSPDQPSRLCYSQFYLFRATWLQMPAMMQMGESIWRVSTFFRHIWTGCQLIFLQVYLLHGIWLRRFYQFLPVVWSLLPMGSVGMPS